MADFSVGSSNQFSQVDSLKSKVELKKTTLDKAQDFVKDHTKDGTFVGDNPVITTASVIVGSVATVATVAKAAEHFPFVEKALDKVLIDNGKLVGATIVGGTAAVLAEDAVQSFKEGSHAKGGLETAGAAVTGLGAAELVGRQFDIPVMRKALSGTADFIGDNAKAVVGGATLIGGGVAIADGVKNLSDGKHLKGGIEVGAGSVALLGGAELIGRQFNIPFVNEALTGPVKALFTSKAGIGVAGGLIAASGAVAGVDGVKRLASDKGLVNDGIGAVEVTASIASITGGTSLVGLASGNEALKQVFNKSGEIVAAVALAGGATALTKDAVKSLKQDGLTIKNTSELTGASIMGLAATSITAQKFGVKVLDQALEKGWKPVVATGLGAVTFKLGEKTLEQLNNKDANPNKVANVAGLGAATVAAGGLTVGMVGEAFGVPVLRNVGKQVLTTTWEVAKPVFKTAIEHPIGTLIGVGAIAGASVYLHSKAQEDEAAKTPKK